MTLRTAISFAFLFPALIVAIVLGTKLDGTSGASAATQTITICKVTSPAGGTGFPFNWTAGAAGPQPGFSLDDGQCTNPPLDITPFGGYNWITEVVPAGWTLTNIACNNTTTPVSYVDIATNPNPNPGAGSPFAPGDDTAALDSNEANVTCTFTNACSTGAICSTPTPTPTLSPALSPTCSVIIDKQTDPAAGTGFGFSSAWIGLQGITLDDGQSITQQVGCGPASGIYNVFETPIPGWTLTNITCVITGGTGSFNIIGTTLPNATNGFEAGDNEVSFHSLTPGASLQCTFSNTLGLRWGDGNCSGSADPVDSLLTLRFDAGLGVKTGECPDFGQVVDVLNASPHPWGDGDCSGEITRVDSLKLLRYDAGLSFSQEPGCPLIGADIQIAEL